MSDLGRNIRLLAETEKLQRQINDLLSQVQDLKDKDAKLGDRSVAYQAKAGGVGQASGDKGAASPVAEAVSSALNDFSGGLLDAFSDAAGNATGTGDDGTVNQQESFSQDLADLETTAPNLGSQLKQLTGLEEVGGSKEAVINLDGLFNAPIYEGSGFDSYNADVDPREDQFLQGVWYETAGGYESSNPYSSAQAYATAVLDPNDPPNAPHRVVSVDAYDEATASTVTVNMSRVSGTFTLNTSVYQSGCVVGTDSWCPSLRPVGDWDADSIHQLAFDGAQFLTNTAEAAADTLIEWTGSGSKVSGETSNNTGVSIEPTDTGGSTVTFTGGNSFTMDSSGVVTSSNY
jgi:hypothetical protein